MNPVDIIVIIILLVVVFLAVKGMRKPTSCGCGCANCTKACSFRDMKG